MAENFYCTINQIFILFKIYQKKQLKLSIIAVKKVDMAMNFHRFLHICISFYDNILNWLNGQTQYIILFLMVINFNRYIIHFLPLELPNFYFTIIQTEVCWSGPVFRCFCTHKNRVNSTARIGLKTINLELLSLWKIH